MAGHGDHDKGRSLFLSGRYEEALACYVRYEERQAGYMGADPGDYLHFWAEKGEILHKLGRLREAVECYGKARACDFSQGDEATLRRIEGLEQAALKELNPREPEV